MEKRIWIFGATFILTRVAAGATGAPGTTATRNGKFVKTGESTAASGKSSGPVPSVSRVLPQRAEKFNSGVSGT